VVARRTVAQAWADRVPGLAAEAGFWALLSLTPLLLVLIGALSYLTPLFGPDLVQTVEARILSLAGNLLTPSAVDQLLTPVLDEVLHHGHATVVSIGFALALWTGSTVMSTYVNTITIAYGMRDVRSAVRTRVLAFGLYLGALLAGTITLPLLVAAPSTIIAASPPRAQPVVAPLVGYGYWPLLAVLCTGLVAALYRAAVPARGPWRRDLPGAAVAMLLWLGGSVLLRWYLSFAIGQSPAYGALSAPVAVLLFLYVTALAVLLGAELNSQIDRLRPEPTNTAAARAHASRLGLRRLRR
jgi:membrane protein